MTLVARFIAAKCLTLLKHMRKFKKYNMQKKDISLEKYASNTQRYNILIKNKELLFIVKK